MRSFPAPRLQLFVCTNEREDAGLGPGCGARGEEVYAALKTLVAEHGLVRDVWVTKTHCLGVCPRAGCTVARYPSSDPIVADVTLEEAASMLDAPSALDPIEQQIEMAEELQRSKVLDLARRLKPGLTLEDIQNPHDFPELDDSDWHYADGTLAGIQAASMAIRAMRRR